VTAADLALVLVSVVVFAAFVVLVVAILALLRSVAELRRTLDEVQREALPLLDELRGTVREAGAEVERVDRLLDAAESISGTVDQASRLGYLAFRAPLIRAVALWRGVGRFLSSLVRPGRGRSRRAGDGSGRSGRAAA
jgi:predicted PurR-regulated permease PerM